MRFAFAAVLAVRLGYITEKAWEDAVEGQTIIHLIYPPPLPPAALSLIFPWDYCNTQEKLKAMVMKNGVNKVRVLWAVSKW